MSSLRAQVLDFVKSTLTGMPTTASRVWLDSERPSPIEQGECPAIVIVDRGDVSVELLTMDWPPLEERRMEFEVVVLVANPANVGPSLLELELAVEKVLTSTGDINSANGLLAQGFQKLSSTPFLSSEGDQYAGRLSISYECRYHVYASAPDVPA